MTSILSLKLQSLKSRYGKKTGIFHYHFMILYHIKECTDQLIILHSNHLVYIFLREGEDGFPDTFHSCAVCDGICTFKLYWLSCFKSRSHACC